MHTHTLLTAVIIGYLLHFAGIQTSEASFGHKTIANIQAAKTHSVTKYLQVRWRPCVVEELSDFLLALKGWQSCG